MNTKTIGWKSLCVDCIKSLSLSWSDSAGGNVHAPCERCGKWTHLRMVIQPTIVARELYKATSKDRRYVKRLRKLGASNYEIAIALGIPENAPVLME